VGVLEQNQKKSEVQKEVNLLKVKKKKVALVLRNQLLYYSGGHTNSMELVSA
jgi:hypothetical protein